MPHEIIVSSGVVRHNVTVSSGVTMEVLAGGDAVRTTVSSGGLQEVYGRALSTTLAGGEFVDIEQIVESGGVATYVTVLENKEQLVDNGGIADHVTLSGSIQTVYGRVDDLVIEDDGDSYIYSGGRVFNATIDDAALYVFPGGLISGAIASSSIIAVSSGAYGREISVSGFGGLLTVYRGAAVSGATVDSGATVEYIDRTPSSGVTVGSGVRVDYSVRSSVLHGLTVSSGASLLVGGYDHNCLVVGTDLLAGTQETVGSRGRDSGAEVAGFVTVSKGGRVQDATVLSGGYELISAGGVISGVTVSSGAVVYTDLRIFDCDLLSGARLDLKYQTTVSGLTVHAGAVMEVLNAHYVSAFVSSGELYGYTRSGTPAVAVFALTGDTAGLSCIVSSGQIGGTDITFVASGGDAIVHAAAGFAPTPAPAAPAAYSLQSAHAELAAGPPGLHRSQA